MDDEPIAILRLRIMNQSVRALKSILMPIAIVLDIIAHHFTAGAAHPLLLTITFRKQPRSYLPDLYWLFANPAIASCDGWRAAISASGVSATTGTEADQPHLRRFHKGRGHYMPTWVATRPIWERECQADDLDFSGGSLNVARRLKRNAASLYLDH